MHVFFSFVVLICLTNTERETLGERQIERKRGREKERDIGREKERERE